MVQNSRVVVAMSGGVDSSVAAALLVDQGYEVIGIMLRLWSEPGYENDNKCCTPESSVQARRVANILRIPFYMINAENEFKSHVVNHLIKGYSQGITPNPCLECNLKIRWGLLLEETKKLGSQFLATGHYARIKQASNEKFHLLKSIDKSKDQSYVLYMLDQSKLSNTILPLGNYTKEEVRGLARKFSLPVYDRPESQDLCFIGRDTYQNFLRRNATQIENRGHIYSQDGNLLGTHSGISFYTIGQRKGLGLQSPHPLYVIEKDASTNSIIVGDTNARASSRFYVSNLNWISGEPPDFSNEYRVKIRYRSDEFPCIISPITNNQILVTLKDPAVDITPGQAGVFYSGEDCIGGGIITK